LLIKVYDEGTSNIKFYLESSSSPMNKQHTSNNIIEFESEEGEIKAAIILQIENKIDRNFIEENQVYQAENQEEQIEEEIQEVEEEEFLIEPEDELNNNQEEGVDDYVLKIKVCNLYYINNYEDQQFWELKQTETIVIIEVAQVTKVFSYYKAGNGQIIVFNSKNIGN
jgi:hypothetical protein